MTASVAAYILCATTASTPPHHHEGPARKRRALFYVYTHNGAQHMITYSDIVARGHLLTPQARQWALANMDYMVRPMALLGSSMKVEKGSAKRTTQVMYLQPAGKVARKTLCAGAARAGCEGPCLISSGMLGLTTGQRAATKRTIIMLVAPDVFERTLLAEIDKAERKALRTGIPALFRLNGTSDIDFSSIYAQRLMSDFYEYTKVLARVRKNALPNLHLTFSGSMYSVQSRAALSKAVQRGNNVAVAYNTAGLASDNVAIPDTMADFDATDLRPLDAPSSIGALSRKGSNKAERATEGAASFFVTRDNVAAFNDIIARSA